MTDKLDILTILEQKFTSGNSIPVTRSSITLEEYEALKALIASKGDGLSQNTIGNVFQSLVKLGIASGDSSIESFFANIEHHINTVCRSVMNRAASESSKEGLLETVTVIDPDRQQYYTVAINEETSIEQAWDYAQTYINNSVMDEVEGAAKWKAVRMIERT